MSNRKYKINRDITAAYMKFNKMAESSIIDELPDKFLVKNGNKITPLHKGAVEKWALDKGFVAGMGYDALSPQEKMTFEGNRQRNTMAIREKDARIAAAKDENLKKYHDQLPETRASRAQHKARMDTIQGADGPVKNLHYKGNKTYPKGGGTNQ